MNTTRKKELLSELKGIFHPQAPDYCVRYAGTGKFYLIDDIDISTQRPKPGAKYKTIKTTGGQIFRIGNIDIFF